MPWKAGDGKRHTKKADTPEKDELWVDIANRLLAKGASDASAIRQANAIVGGTAKYGKKK
jgi:hypothetical protein